MAFPSLKSKAKQSEFEKVPPGTHFAFCTRLIDLGFHEATYADGNKSVTRKVFISFEVPEALHSTTGKPLAVDLQLTNSLSKKAALRGLLESWRGKPFTKEELDGFELTSIVGQPCQVSVVHNEGKEGRSYANINAILGLTKMHREAMKTGALPKAPEAEILVYVRDAHDQGTFDKLPKFLQDKILASVEDPELAFNEKAKVAEKAYAGAGDHDEFDDDIPF